MVLTDFPHCLVLDNDVGSVTLDTPWRTFHRELVRPPNQRLALFLETDPRRD
jgi:hypothetical protein